MTHDVNPVLHLVDRVLFVVNGRWAAGTPDEVLTSERLTDLYGSHVDVLRVHGRVLVVGETTDSGFDLAEPHHLPVIDDDPARPRRACAMLDQLIHLLGYDFVQNAIAAGHRRSPSSSGVVSRFVVARNMSFAVHALAELGFTGAAGAIVVGVSPVLGLLAGTTITAPVHRHARRPRSASATRSSASSWPSASGSACCS